MKTCRVCKLEKSLDLFVKSKKTNDGREARCKSCHSYAQTKYYKQNLKENLKNKVYLKVDNKVCNRCKIDKKINEFSKSHRNATGHRGTCNQCYMELSKISRDKRYKERMSSLDEIICSICKKTKKLKFYSKGQLSSLNPACKECKSYIDRTVNKKSISTLYQLSRQQYNEMVIEQNNLCFICKKPEKYKMNGVVKRLSVDHCHKSQAQGISKVRSLLCGACNVGLGSFCDSSELLRKAADYLDIHA